MVEEVKVNPFTPDRPVPPRMFAGRWAEVRQIRDALTATLAGSPQHILIQGERWIGKSSIALYAKNMGDMADVFLDRPGAFVYVSFISLGTCQTLNEVCVAILDSLKGCQNAVRKRIFDILSGISGLQIGLFGITLARGAKHDFLLPTFADIFERVLDEASTVYRVFMIILDETEQVSGLKGISSFFKSFLEKLSADGYGNVMLVMTATPEGFESFTSDHLSFPRLFRIVDLEAMSQDESRDLLAKALAEGIPRMSLSDTAAAMMFRFSGGLPGLLQELGYAAFEADTDGEISEIDVFSGLLGSAARKGALDTLYDKHFRKILQKDLLSERYRLILDAFVASDTWIVTRRYLRSQLPQWDEKRLDRYLGILRERGVVKSTPSGKRGEYELVSPMLGLWLRLDQVRREREGKQEPG